MRKRIVRKGELTVTKVASSSVAQRMPRRQNSLTKFDKRIHGEIMSMFSSLGHVDRSALPECSVMNFEPTKVIKMVEKEKCVVISRNERGVANMQKINCTLKVLSEEMPGERYNYVLNY